MRALPISCGFQKFISTLPLLAGNHLCMIGGLCQAVSSTLLTGNHICMKGGLCQAVSLVQERQQQGGQGTGNAERLAAQ